MYSYSCPYVYCDDAARNRVYFLSELMRRLSYQSGPNSWKYLIVFIGIFVSSTSLAEPYQDTKNRYTLEIPEGWTLAPIFGRPDSARFQRKLRNSKQPAWLKLTVMIADSRDLRALEPLITVGSLHRIRGP